MSHENQCNSECQGSSRPSSGVFLMCSLSVSHCLSTLSYPSLFQILFKPTTIFPPKTLVSPVPLIQNTTAHLSLLWLSLCSRIWPVSSLCNHSTHLTAFSHCISFLALRVSNKIASDHEQGLLALSSRPFPEFCAWAIPWGWCWPFKMLLLWVRQTVPDMTRQCSQEPTADSCMGSGGSAFP